MRILATGITAVAAMAAPAFAQDPSANAPVSYHVGFANAAHHEARIAATFRALPAGPATFRMSRSSPGRYAIHEFAKNVYSVSATDGAGRPLAIERTDPYSWTVPQHDGTVVVTYTLFGDRGDGTYSQIDTSHAHLNMPATFLWAEGQEDRPIRVHFEPREGWKVATQLPGVPGAANSFWAPHLQYFMDSPTELSDFMLREWQIGSGNDRATIRLAIHHQGTAEEADRFAAMAQDVVAQQVAVWGGAPAFDFGTYTFIADYLPWIDGDGMEHRNSTIIAMPAGLAAANYRQLGTLSHEFFHSWNVERLRPAELEPFDFTRANPTPSLWFAEGFTQYYGPLTVQRAGQSSLEEFLRGLGGTLNYIVNNPARDYGGPQEMSLRAPFVDAATAIDPQNPNIFASYYPYGAVVALALDLSLRGQHGTDLDAYMRHLWARHGAHQADYAPQKPYTPADLRDALAELTGDAAFATRFFRDHVEGSALPDFAPLLAQAGLVVRPRAANRAWIGEQALSPENGALAVGDTPPPASALYRAGLDRGDVLLAVDGTAVADAAALAAVLGRHAPGHSVPITYRRFGAEHAGELTIGADPSIKVVADPAATPAQLAFRAAWLGPKPVD